MEKRIKIELKETRQYVQFWNGLMKLTDREVDVLTALMDGNEELGTTENRRHACATLGISKEVMNTYIKRLKDKKAINYEKGHYKLAGILQGGKTVEILLWRTS
tara:strand:- start:1870 stop:2181 length:312 start_codon:yes stop_codon:yes gene_type:complete